MVSELDAPSQLSQGKSDTISFHFHLIVLTCDANEVLCNGSKNCIPEAAICDGQNDCEDKEDELNCPGLLYIHELCHEKMRLKA